MFQKTTATGYHPVLEKIHQKTLVFGAHTLLTEFRLEQGTLLPRHSHPHEKTGYLEPAVTCRGEPMCSP